MDSWTIAEEFTLPSKGKVYPAEKKVNANVKLRSMTTEEEMKRLGHSPYVYKMFSDMIDDCLIDKPGIPTYDLCLGDYQYLLYKLRTVTYGPDYNIQSYCPHCGNINKVTVNLDSLKINSYDESMNKSLEFQLPISKKLVKLKWQTPRMLDEVEKRTKELNSQSSNSVESAVLYNVMYLIDTIDGQSLDDVQKENFVRHLPMKDTNSILQHAKKLMGKLGIETTFNHTCENCSQDYIISLPITGEFFGPTEDEEW